MAKAPLIVMTEEINAQSLQYREGYQAYFAGKREVENPYATLPEIKNPKHILDWSAGWLEAFSPTVCLKSQGKSWADLVPETSKFAAHIAQVNEYDRQACWIWSKLEATQLFAGEVCPHDAHFKEFGEEIVAGKIELTASIWWGGEEHIRTQSVPIEWFDAKDASSIDINAFVTNLLEIKAAEKAAKEAAEVMRRNAAARAKDLEMLQALAAQYPVEFSKIQNS